MSISDDVILRIRADVDQAITELKKLNTQLSNSEKQAKTTQAGTAGLVSAWGKLMAVAYGAAQAFQFVAKETEETMKAEAQLEAVLKSTGGAAGMTSDACKDLAQSLSQVTAYDNDAILAGENLLLTFTRIGSDVFPDATKAMLDMSTAIGQDLKASAIQLGKALNDPMQGLTALQRVGVSFTQEQKNMIQGFLKTNDVASAQKVIIGELSREFGGSATAASKTFGGQLQQMKNQLGDIAAGVGKELMPILSLLNTMFKKTGADGGSFFSQVLAGVWGQLAKAVVQGKAFIEVLKQLLDISGNTANLEKQNENLKNAAGNYDYLRKKIVETYGSFDNFNKKVAEGNSQAVYLKKGYDDATKSLYKYREATAKLQQAGAADDMETTYLKALKAQEPGAEGPGGAAVQSPYSSDKLTADMDKFNQERRKAEEEYFTYTKDISAQKQLAEQTKYEDLLIKFQDDKVAQEEIQRVHEENMAAIDDEVYAAKIQKAQQYVSQYAGALSGMFGQVSAISNAYFQMEGQKVDKDYKKKKTLIGLLIQDKEQAAMAEQYLDYVTNRKKAELAYRAAVINKVMSMANIAINTAVAISSALGLFPPPLGIAMAAVVAGMGFAQLALAAATPIPPPLAEGGIIRGTDVGTLVRAGEGGKTEAIVPLENADAMERAGLGNTYHIHLEGAIVTNQNLPQDFIDAIDRGLYRLNKIGQSQFAGAL